jgi:hypothetical protein
MFSFLYHCQDFYRIWLYIWVKRRVSYKKQELLTLHEHLTSSLVFLVCSVLLIFSVFCVVLLCVFAFWATCCDVHYTFCIKICFVRRCLQLFVGGRMSYLRYLYLFAYSGVQHILCCVFLRLCYQLLWIVLFLFPLTLIWIYKKV